MSKIKENVRSCLNSKEGIAAVALFGSQVTGQLRDDSDVDIAVLFEPNQVPSPLDIVGLREKISDQISKDVDLVCLNTCSPIIGMQILQHGEVVILKNKTLYNKYLIRLFTDYHDLKRMRKPAENAILERKYYDR